jgi:hypothetical protein
MGTTGIRKKFNQGLYNKADHKAKDVIRSYLQSKGKSLLESEENYFCDIEEEGGQSWEVEIKYSWKGEWPTAWKDVRIPYRKKRLLDKVGSDMLTFFVLNSECKKAWEIPGIVVEQANVVEVPNRYVPEGELFYSIEVSDAKLVDMNSKGE